VGGLSGFGWALDPPVITVADPWFGFQFMLCRFCVAIFLSQSSTKCTETGLRGASWPSPV